MGILQRLRATRLTSTDLGYLGLKCALFVGLSLAFGLVLGVALALLILYLVEKFIILTYKVEPLNATDKNVFYDQDSNRCHIMGTILLEKTDAVIVSLHKK